jgi:hypothetical protein
VYALADAGDPAYQDVAVVPASGGPPSLALVGSFGLDLLTFDPTASGASQVASVFRRDTLPSSSAWAGALRVGVGDLDADGTTDFVGILPDQRTVLVRRTVSGAPVESQFTLLETIEDLLVIQ